MNPQQIPIAVVGVSALFPESVDKTSFWRNILDERDLIVDVPASHWLIEDYFDEDPSARDKTYARRGGFLPEVDFDAMQWGVPPTIMPATDSTQLLALIVAQRVIDDACRGQFGEEIRDKTSCFLGVTSAQELLGTMVSRLQKPVWVKALREMGMPESQVEEACGRIADQYVEWQESSFPGVLGNVVAGRIANRLDLGGANCVTDAACASTFSALSMGINELRLGTSDLSLVGGADTMNDIFMYMCFSKTPALSATGDCRPFSDQADGTLLGEGIGMVALKRLDDAERDGDSIYAVIKGLGASSDGRAKSVYAPVASGQARALRRAYEQAGYSPATVGLMEAHGTATKAGDAAEFGGLRMVFEEARQEGGDAPWCALGSIKAQIGHTKAAAGAAGLFKVIMALHHRVLPATLKIDKPNPALEVEQSPFYLNATTRPWIQAEDTPRRASVSSFGFGGSNFHITLEEYRGKSPAPVRLRTVKKELVLLSAVSVEALADACREMSEAAAQDGMLQVLARTSQKAFDAKLDCRLAVVAEDEAALRGKLDNAVSMVAAGKSFRSPTGVMFERGEIAGDVGFVFPGQGSQYVGMGGKLALAFGEARGAWDAAAGRSVEGEGLHDVVFPRAVFDDDAKTAQTTRLTDTQRAQPALALTSLSMLRLLEKAGVTPTAVVGHSFGEVMALQAAGVFDAETAVAVAAERGRLMAEAAAEPGAMLSVSAPLALVETQLEGVADVVVANHNGPKQVVISGTTAGIDAMDAKLREAGLRTTRLNVATAFHSRIVAPAVPALRAFLDGVTLSAPTVPVMSNRDAAPYPSDPSAMRDTLAEQLSSRVRFVEAVEAMYARGVRTFVEVGPGSVLTGLVGRILKGREHRAVALDRKGRDGVASLWSALGELACSGVALEWDVFWQEYGEPEDPRERAPMKMPVPISGTSYGKLYPPKGGAAALPKPNPERVEEPAPQVTTPMTVSTNPEFSAPAARVVTPAAANPATAAPVVASPTAAAPMMAAPVAPAVMAAPVAMAPAVRVTGDAGSAMLAAFEIAQRQAAAAQESFQRTLAASHAQYMTASVSSWNTIASAFGGATMPVPNFAAAAPTAQPVATQPVHAMQPVAAPMAAVPMAAVPMAAAPVVAAPVAAAPVAAAPVAAAPVAAAPVAAAAEPTPVAPPAAAAGPVDLKSLVLDVVAEATGYPKEMLGLDMGLEADLGIDSIKRVEILSTLVKREPRLAELPTSEVSQLGTLEAILEALSKALPEESAAPAAPPVSTAAAPAATPAAAAAPGADLQKVVLAAVADKTGYPQEMLGLDMNLEADLGIDSIKRVEILSAVDKQVGDLPQIPAADMADKKTLGEIIAFLAGFSGVTPMPAGAPAPTAAPAPSASIPTASIPTAPLKTRRPAAVPVVAPGVATPGLRAQAVCIIDDGAGVAVALAKMLGGQATVVAEAPATATTVVDLAGLRVTDDTSVDVSLAAFRRFKTVAATFTDKGGTYVAVQDSGGDFGLSGAGSTAGGIVALARTARHEWPQATVRAIDVLRGDRDAEAVARALYDELVDGASTPDVGLAEGKRVVIEDLEVTEPAATAAPMGKDDVVLASGGGRGVTAVSLIALAKKTGAAFALLGRSALRGEDSRTVGIDGDAELMAVLLEAARQRGEKATPADLKREASALRASREVKATVAAIEAAGGRAAYYVADVTDAERLRAVVQEVASDFGAVTAIVHGAGVLADKPIVNKEDASFERVLRTKVLGLDALLSACQVGTTSSVRRVCLFSSVAARYGNAGQSDYAMANELLNQSAKRLARELPNVDVCALGWGPWRGGMVTPALERHFTAMGVQLIEPAAGADAFVSAMADTSHVAIIGGSLPDTSGANVQSGPQRSVDVCIDAVRHAHLSDHQVRGVVVVPVALALELMARGLRSAFGGLHLASLSDVRVLKGLRLEGFEDGPTWLRVDLEQVTNGEGATVAVTLVDDRGIKRYGATAALVTTAPAAASARASNLSESTPFEGAIYGGVLFHGPRFQVIDSIDVLGPGGSKATLVGSRVEDGSDSALDVGLFDGALQLALRWTEATLRGPSLPTAVARVEVFGAGAVPGPVTAELRRLETTVGVRASCNITLSNLRGDVVMRLMGVETHLLPATTAATATPQAT